MEEISPRIPKYFIPEKYIINFSPDYSKLQYTIKSEILIKSESENIPYLILNGSSINYTIKYLLLSKFDNIADEWVEIGKNSENSENHSHIFLFNLPEADLKYQVQDGMYIPLNHNIKKGEKLKLNIFLEGKISPEFNNNALYICTNIDSKRDLFKDNQTLEKEWKDNNYDKINTLSKEELSQNIFFKNLVTVFFTSPTQFHLNMPCFDEPCYKAVFSFQLELDKYFVDAFKQLKCVSNGSLIHVELNQDTNKYIFSYSDTPLMSCYLFTFVIGNYDLIETVNENKIKIRVFTPLRNHHDGALCMNLAQYSLKFYQKFFDIPYYYDKLDFIPVPQMSFRAMENLGCIVFKNEAMLCSHFQPLSEKKFISRTICHEISHMWFGDLVTMEWWDDIWLNEGFARIFEYLCLNEIGKKENKFWDNFLYYIYNNALIYDESQNTHPIVRKIINTNMINTIFDTISYCKGSAVIKMLMHYIGIDNFRKSISSYLKKYMYKNTNTTMLWAIFDEITKLNVSELMNEWVNFSGHPLLSVDIIKKDENYFFKLEQNSIIKDDNTIWKLPVFIKSKNFQICRLIKTKEYEISFEELNLNYQDIEKGENFVVFNDDLKGFYRVKYCNEILLNSILENFKKNQNIIMDEKSKDINFVNDHDIFGLLSFEKYNNNFEGIKKIINYIKPISNSDLILTYMKKLYVEFESKYCFLEGFEEYITNQDSQLKIINSINDYNNFFISIVDKDKNKLDSLVKKFYINEENKDMYKNQFNDEYDSLYLYFRVVLDDNEEIAKRVLIPDVDKYFEFLNKNYKYTLIQIMMKYIYLIKDNEFKKKLLDIIIQDYTNNYYSSSYYINLEYKSAICTFDSLDIELMNYLYINLIMKPIFLVSADNLLKGKNRRKIFDIFIYFTYKKYFNFKSTDITGTNIINYFEKMDPNSSALKKFWFNEPKGDPLLVDVIYNYFRDKFEVTSDEDAASLMLISESFGEQ